MINKSPKPVKQCEGCILNLTNRCAAFEFPAQQWQEHDCEGYNNPILIKKYRSGYLGEGAHERKRQRVAKAKASHDVEHRDALHQKAPRHGVLKKS